MPVIRELSEAVEVERVQRQRRSWVWVDAGALANQSGLSTGWVMSSASEWRWVCLGFLSYISEVFFFPFSFLWWLSVQRGVCNNFFFFFEWFISMFPIEIEFFLVALLLRQIFVFFFQKSNVSAQLSSSWLLFWLTSKSLPTHLFLFHPAFW